MNNTNVVRPLRKFRWILGLLLFAVIFTLSGCSGDNTDKDKLDTVGIIGSVIETPFKNIETPVETPIETPVETLIETPEPELSATETITVYVTETGAKYHSSGCRYLSKSEIPLSLENAKKSYEPCGVCNPPN